MGHIGAGRRAHARSAVGICEHGRQRSKCKECHAAKQSSTNVSSSTYYVMTPTPNNTHASQLTTNEPTIRSNNSALLASNPSVVALALSTYTKPPFTAAVHKTRRQHTNCPYGNKNKLTGGVVTPRHVVPAPCGRLRREREVIVRIETIYTSIRGPSRDASGASPVCRHRCCRSRRAPPTLRL